MGRVVALVILGLAAGLIVSQFALDDSKRTTVSGRSALPGISGPTIETPPAITNRIEFIDPEPSPVLTTVSPTAPSAETLARRRDSEWRLEEMRQQVSALQGRALPTQGERLFAARFSANRAEWIERIYADARTEAEHALRLAQQSGQTPNVWEYASRADTRVREAMGNDEEFERYLRAVGRFSSLDVTRVQAGSDSERAGFRVGDRIQAVNGRRIFARNELEKLLEQSPGTPVVVEIIRDRQPAQLVLTRGRTGLRIE